MRGVGLGVQTDGSGAQEGGVVVLLLKVSSIVL